MLAMPHSACTSSVHQLKPASPQVISSSAPGCTCAFVSGLTILHSSSRADASSSSLLLDVLLLHVEDTRKYFATGPPAATGRGSGAAGDGDTADDAGIDLSDDRAFCPPKRFAGIGANEDVPSERTFPSHCVLLEWLTFTARMSNLFVKIMYYTSVIKINTCTVAV